MPVELFKLFNFIIDNITYIDSVAVINDTLNLHNKLFISSTNDT